MKVTYTRSEMLALRRTMTGHEPLRNDCTIEVTEGIDTDELFLHQLRAWYLNLLDHGPREWIAPENIASAATASPLSPSGSRIVLPDYCRRVFEVRLQGWITSVHVEAADKLPKIMNRQQNPFSAATVFHPVAVQIPGPDGHCGEILAWPAGNGVTVLTAATDRGEDVYSFDESALAGWNTIVPDIQK